MTRFGVPHGVDPVEPDRYATWDAAYVLGSLDSNERREYETHLAGCAQCRAAVAELSGMPALLAMLELDDVRALDEAEPEPPLRPEVLQSVLNKVSSRRRRSRWITSGAVGLAAALLAVGMVIAIRPEIIGLQRGAEQQQTAQMLEMTKVSQTPINASIAMTSYGWGTRIDMACTYGDWGRRDAPPQNLGMVVVGRDGSREEIATWLGLSGATALPSGNTQKPMEEIAAVQMVSSPDGKVLLEKKL
ncbi:zf-HC2 domain-containing protein [Mycolicibacterium wolinskyi]|uniref:Anti-sigma factor n=1 Tax=Mycolicibacterium wolinskyi TaxID=59750 RepID=A0A132PU08_9MYCO|nr:MULTISPECIES: zf-HC2 domain-containing protein [Mycolicibacterium]KWX25816.1 anti-sigma factor [Mycolicibacterium wolinskyi]MCV7288377.1 zf-HC2 domain-containing protein [Mycolicibacterium wolinskyi]MCV7295599.1 zf-HC2 domain-containing protein [Mycolicibacterium goodii]ORX11630.1 anti-sigma factor [Mycolicibacterium wolinskyi]